MQAKSSTNGLIVGIRKLWGCSQCTYFTSIVSYTPCLLYYCHINVTVRLNENVGGQYYFITDILK